MAFQYLPVSLQETFAGVYVCNAKNVVRENGTEHDEHTTKEIDIQIIGRLV